MSSQGSVKVVNVQNRPQLVSLSTKNASLKNSTMSTVSWDMRDSISVADANFTAVISLYSMIFYNTFANVTTSNNTLKILSTWLDVNNNQQNFLITVNVPPGHYDINGLVNYLNTDGVCNRNPAEAGTTYQNYYVGMGVYGDSVNFPPFEVSSTDAAKVLFQFPTAGLGGALSTNLGVHVYKGFYLIVDDDTTPFLNLLGILNYNQFGALNNVRNITSAGTTYTVIGNDVTTGGASTPYSYISPWSLPTTVESPQTTPPNAINLGGPTALSVSWEQIFANTRMSSHGLNLGDTVGVVPVVAAYGYKTVYQPPNPFKCIIPNFNINRFRIKVCDADTGLPVDFQNTDWSITLNIEFFEIDNEYKSERALMGYGRTVHPTLHTTNLDHNMPHSGTGGYKSSGTSGLKKRKGES